MSEDSPTGRVIDLLTTYARNGTSSELDGPAAFLSARDPAAAVAAARAISDGDQLELTEELLTRIASSLIVYANHSEDEVFIPTEVMLYGDWCLAWGRERMNSSDNEVPFPVASLPRIPHPLTSSNLREAFAAASDLYETNYRLATTLLNWVRDGSMARMRTTAAESPYATTLARRSQPSARPGHAHFTLMRDPGELFDGPVGVEAWCDAFVQEYAASAVMTDEDVLVTALSAVAASIDFASYT